MNLYLASKWESPYDGVYHTEEKLPVYRVAFTTNGTHSSSLTIERATIDLQQNLPKYHALAEFDFHRRGKDVLRINGTTHQASEFFNKSSPLNVEPSIDSENPRLGSDRIFRSTDGQEYVWTLGKKRSELHLNTQNKPVVAVFHPRKLALLGLRAGSSPFLEVTPVGMEILDLVFCTFVYVEKLRWDRQQHDNINWDRPGVR